MLLVKLQRPGQDLITVVITKDQPKAQARTKGARASLKEARDLKAKAKEKASLRLELSLLQVARLKPMMADFCAMLTTEQEGALALQQ
jgi:hypothetical protein